MDIVVRGSNVPVSNGLREAARDKLSKVARFIHDATRVEVEFSELRNRRVHDTQQCEVTVHLKKHLVRAHAAATEPEAALDLVVDKVEHQAARIKDKRVMRSHGGRRHAANGSRAVERSFDALDEEEQEDEEAIIVKAKRFASKPMGPQEAALQMQLLGHDFFLFTNAENGNAAVIYRRRDGHLGLIETIA